MTSPLAQPIQYKVISSEILAPDDRATILAKLAEFKSGYQARQFANQKGFGVEVLDPRGRVVLLKWQGVDVALLYERTISTITGPTARLAKVDAKNYIQDPQDAWVMLNLVTTRYDQEVSGLKTRVVSAEFSAEQANRLRAQLELQITQARLVLDAMEVKG